MNMFPPSYRQVHLLGVSSGSAQAPRQNRGPIGRSVCADYPQNGGPPLPPSCNNTPNRQPPLPAPARIPVSLRLAGLVALVR